MTGHPFICSAGVDWVQVLGPRRLPIFYGPDGMILEPFVEYGQAVARKKVGHSDQAYRTSIDDVGYHLSALIEYLASRDGDWRSVDDEALLGFRTFLEARAFGRNRTRSPLSAKRNINRYLRTVYRFYTWAQEREMLKEHVDWPEGLIRSRLPEELGREAPRIASDQLYPLCFVRCGEGSRQTYQYVATDVDMDRLVAHFFDHHGLDVALRNEAILALVNEVGWRQGSVKSLSIDSFSAEAVARAEREGSAFVTPALQKRGYENAFEVRAIDMYRMHQYIIGGRRLLMEKNGWTEDHCDRALFIDTVSGKRLARKSITEIFSRAFTAIGAPKGAGIHSLRRKCTDDTTDLEVEARKREGRTLDPVNIAIVLKRKLGHSSLQAQEAYARAMVRTTYKSFERRQQDRIRELEAEVTRLRAKMEASCA